MLRVKVPCADEGDFYARFADRIAENGLRVPAAVPPAIGAHARVALEFKDGGVLAGDAVVEEHVDVEAGRGVKVRFLKLDRPTPAARAAPAPSAPPPAARPAADPELPLPETLFDDAPATDGRTGALSFTVSTEIAAAVEQRTARFQRAAIAAGVLAAIVALAGVAVARWSGPSTPDTAAAHVQAAERRLADGKLTGRDGALDHLLAAKRLQPGDPATARRLERLADLLERLAAGALDRGDLAVASIHLAAARAAAPERSSLRAKQAELDRRARPSR
jgi:hypothetical protein